MGAEVTDESVLEDVLGVGDTIEVKGKEYRLSPISLKNLGRIQQESFRFYKLQYLETFADTIDLIPNGLETFQQERQKVAKWTYKNLPKMKVHDPSSIEVTKKVRAKLTEMLDEIPESDDMVRVLTSIMLDEGELTADELGITVRTINTAYSAWWATSTHEGQALMTFYSLSPEHPKLTLEKVKSWPAQTLMEGAIKAEAVTAPSAGNS